MNRDRVMLLVIFLNLFCTCLHLLRGEWSAGLGWGVATMWSMRVHGMSLRQGDSEKGGSDEG